MLPSHLVSHHRNKASTRAVCMLTRNIFPTPKVPHSKPCCRALCPRTRRQARRLGCLRLRGPPHLPWPHPLRSRRPARRYLQGRPPHHLLRRLLHRLLPGGPRAAAHAAQSGRQFQGEHRPAGHCVVYSSCNLARRVLILRFVQRAATPFLYQFEPRRTVLAGCPELVSRASLDSPPLACLAACGDASSRKATRGTTP